VSLDRDRCLTCSDEAVSARVRSVDGLVALVSAGETEERVAIDLVPDARPGDVLLCHAGVALDRLASAQDEAA
jgi:hydrogenase maturation factor